MNKFFATLLSLFLMLNFTSCTIQESDESNTNNTKATTTTATCSHSWWQATCTEPEKCSTCGATRGSALGHSYQEATCSSPEICSTCGTTRGSALEHNYQAATCVSPQQCTICGETYGAALGHSYQAATCTSPQQCTVCGETYGAALGHSYLDGYCTKCSEKDPVYFSCENIFPGKPERLRFYINYAGGISLSWKHNYIGDKTINYITVTYTLYDAVGNPTPDDITGKSTKTVRLIGPFNPGEPLSFNSDEFVYCDTCDKVCFDKLYLEYADGTTTTIRYGWQSATIYDR